MKRNNGIIGDLQTTTSADAKGVFDIHDIHIKRRANIWPTARKITAVTPNYTSVSEGTELIITITGQGWLATDTIYYSIVTTLGTTMVDADLQAGSSGSNTYITTVDGSFSMSNVSLIQSQSTSIYMKFKAEYPADNEGNKFKFKVYRDSGRTDLIGESAEVTVVDVTGTAASDVYYTLKENRYGTNMGTIYHYLTDTSGNIIHTFGTTGGNYGSPTWLSVDWSSNPDSLASGTQFHMCWRHIAGSSFRADYAIDEVRLYIAGNNVETWGFESATDGAGTGGFSGYTGWRHANQTQTTSSTTAFSVNSPVTVSTATGYGIWNVDAGSTPSSSTGPTGAYQGTNFCYTETTSRFSGNHWLFSEVLTVP